MRSKAYDAKKASREKSKEKFKASNNAETEFYRAIKKVATASGHLIDAYTDGARIINEAGLAKALKEYSEQLGPWAARQSAKLLEQVSKSNKRAYARQGVKLNSALANFTKSDYYGQYALALMEEQVGLIKSIPLEAGQRAQKIAAENFIAGNRAYPDDSVIDDLKKQMGMSTEVAVNRAKLIARTETARANSSFVQARAISVGAQGYIWRTTMDGAERESHAKMNGKFVEYDKPPHLSDGTTGHAGTFPNCRCYQDPVLPEY